MARPTVPSRPLRRVRRALRARRRPLAAVCAAVAMASALHAGAAPAPRRTLVLTAARDLPGGVVVAAGDLRRTAFEPGSVPSGVLPSVSAAVGRTTSGPVRAGEPLTDVRLVTASLLAGRPGVAAVPVRLGDAAVVRLLRVGDRVDLLAADPQGRHAATVLAREVTVLAIPRPVDDGLPTAAGGALVVLAVPSASAGVVAQASVSSFLSVVLTH